MRRTTIALGWLLCPASLVAAPVPAGSTPAAAPVTQAQLQSAAADYVRNLNQVLIIIERSYARPASARPVSRADLVEAAVTGLYETAQVPVPGTLKADIQKADQTALDAVLVKARLTGRALAGRA
jgi:hypothetical protein